MKIALLTDGIYPYVLGGMQRHSYYLCKYLLQAGIQVDLYHTQWEEQEDITQLAAFTQAEKTNLKSFVIPWPKSDPFPGHYIRASYKYSVILFEEFLQNSMDADFIYIKGFAGWKLLEEKKRGRELAPTGIKFHGYEMYQIAPNWKVKLQHFLLRGPVKWNTFQADYVFSYGGKITSIIQQLGIPRERILEFPSGIEETWIAPVVDSVSHPRKFVFLGRYERRKGVEELFQALRLLTKTEEFEFHFIGPIPDHLQLQGDSFIYHGKIMEGKKIQEILQAADILVCPSYAEGMPNVILEAMASGLCIIATDVGAVSAMVSSQNGYLIQPANQSELTAAIKKALLLTDEELLSKKNHSLSQIKQFFMWQEIIVKTMGEIEKISSTSKSVS